MRKAIIPDSLNTLNRREFLNSTAKATVALGVLSTAPFVARGRVLGANDRIGIGFIGVGGRGSSHVATVQRLIKGGENAGIVAVNDAFRYRLMRRPNRQARKLTGNTRSCWRTQMSMWFALPRRTGCTCRRRWMRSGRGRTVLREADGALVPVRPGKDVL